MKCKIAILCETGIRFIYPQVPDLAELLGRDGHAVEIIGPQDAEVEDWNAGRGFRYHGLLARKAHGWWYNLQFIFMSFWRLRRFDKVIATTTVSLPAAMLAKLLFGKPYAFYALECQIPGERSAGFYACLQHGLRWTTRTIAVTGYHRARIMQRFLRLPERPAIVENTALFTTAARDQCESNDVRREAIRILGKNPGFIVVANGGLGLINGIDIVIDSLAMLPPGVTIVMFGPVEDDILARIERAADDHGNVVYLGQIAGGRNELISFLRTADAGLVLKKRGRGINFNDRFYTPNKIYDFVAASVPSLCSPNMSLSYVERSGLGVMLRSFTSKALCDAITELIGQGEQARCETHEHISRLFSTRYNFEFDAQVFLAFASQRMSHISADAG